MHGGAIGIGLPCPVHHPDTSVKILPGGMGSGRGGSILLASFLGRLASSPLTLTPALGQLGRTAAVCDLQR